MNNKFINACDCKTKLCHQYCITAFVLRKRKIFCSDCKSYFPLQVKTYPKYIDIKPLYSLLILYSAFLILILGVY